jgi:DedD protein
MGLLSIFQRNKQTSAAKPGRGGKSAARQAPLANAQNPADTAEAVREARARARTRLMGATVLLLVGVIGFPLLFETQPRPIPVDLPIEIPARNAPGVIDPTSHGHAAVHAAAALPAVVSAPALTPALSAASSPRPESVSYDARPSAPVTASEPASVPAHRSAFASLAAALTSGPASTAPASTPVAASSSTVAPTKPTARPARPPVASAAMPPVAAPSRPAAAAHTGPVLPPPPAAMASPTDAKPADAAGRFVVQVGAFLEDSKVREARSKVEKLGMKTYTQPVDTPTGRRVRVRVGPYATKAEADKSAARIKADGMPAVVLAL